eukprot:scaffold14.g1229.t1
MMELATLDSSNLPNALLERCLACTSLEDRRAAEAVSRHWRPISCGSASLWERAGFVALSAEPHAQVAALSSFLRWLMNRRQPPSWLSLMLHYDLDHQYPAVAAETWALLGAAVGACSARLERLALLHTTVGADAGNLYEGAIVEPFNHLKLHSWLMPCRRLHHLMVASYNFRLEPGLLRSLPALQHLCITNGMTFMLQNPDAFVGQAMRPAVLASSSLTSLDIWGSGVRGVTLHPAGGGAALAQLTQLRRLAIRDQQLPRMGGDGPADYSAFASLQCLTQLLLRCSDVPAELAALTNLQRLKLRAQQHLTISPDTRSKEPPPVANPTPPGIAAPKAEAVAPWQEVVWAPAPEATLPAPAPEPEAPPELGPAPPRAEAAPSPSPPEESTESPLGAAADSLREGLKNTTKAPVAEGVASPPAAVAAIQSANDTLAVGLANGTQTVQGGVQAVQGAVDTVRQAAVGVEQLMGALG